jgi:NitT/TauT family transport system substrate-binding protein
MLAKQEWLDRNPDTARRLARAWQRTLQWIAAHTPEEIREKLPAEMRSPDAAIDVQVIRWGREAYTTDGAMPKGAPEVMKRYVDASVAKVRDAKFDLASTWTNEYLPGKR